MPSANIRCFLPLLAAGAIAAHAAVSCLVAAVLCAGYTHRVPDVTRWRGKQIDGFQFIGSFLAERTNGQKRRTLVFGGSSFTYGYLWQERVIFSRIFAEARPDILVLNASLLAADVSSVNDWIVCGAKHAGAHPDVMVVEIPVVNTVGTLAGYRRQGQPAAPPLSKCDSGERASGFLKFAAEHVLGLGWLPFLWDNEAYPKADSILSIGPVPAGYFVPEPEFEAVQAEFDSQITEMLRNAKKVAMEVYAYPSPVFVAGLADAGADQKAMQRQLDFALAACAKVSEVRCLNPSQRLSTRDMFANLTHLNQRGHRAMGEWLAREVQLR